MQASVKNQTHLGCLVSTAVMGPDISKPFQRQIESYLQKNGTEWTCKRAKAIWNAALLLRNGDREKAIGVYRENSISYHKTTGIPKGIEGVPVRRFVNAERPIVLKRYAAVLRWYTELVLPSISKSQAKKALTAIAEPSDLVSKKEEIRIQGKNDAMSCLKRKRVKVVTLDMRPIQPGERHAEHLKATSKYYSRNRVPGELRVMPYSSMAMSFMTEPWVPEGLDRMTPCYEMRQFIRTDERFNDQPLCGEIMDIQEQGCKARTACKPTAWLQLAFMPLGKRVETIAEQLFPKESCALHQTSGAYTMMAHMEKGGTVTCTDLSSATDRFPRWYTEGVLDAIGYQIYADALEEVCDHEFVCKFAPNGRVKYSVGQPMGLYGSFPMFHLSNMVLADSCVQELQTVLNAQPFGRNANIDFETFWFERSKFPKDMDMKPLVAFPDESYFLTLGDDIVFSDSRIADRYKKRMNDLGVSISESKSFSGNVCEFAGFIGLRTNKSVAVFRPYKTSAGQTITNGVQFLDSLGVKVSKISSWWARQFKTYSYTQNSRDLALDPLVGDNVDSVQRNTYRGDTRTMVNMCGNIALLCPPHVELPDLSGNTRINTLPLFREQRHYDFYGYSPEKLVQAEEENVPTPRSKKHGLQTDPLMVESRDLQQGLKTTPDRIILRTVPQVSDPPKDIALANSHEEEREQDTLSSAPLSAMRTSSSNGMTSLNKPTKEALNHKVSDVDPRVRRLPPVPWDSPSDNSEEYVP